MHPDPIHQLIVDGHFFFEESHAVFLGLSVPPNGAISHALRRLDTIELQNAAGYVSKVGCYLGIEYHAAHQHAGHRVIGHAVISTPGREVVLQNLRLYLPQCRRAGGAIAPCVPDEQVRWRGGPRSHLCIDDVNLFDHPPAVSGINLGQ